MQKDLHIRLSECAGPKQKSAQPGKSVRLGGKLHSFEALLPAYGEPFVSDLLDCFTEAFFQCNPNTTEKRSSRLRSWLTDLHRRARVTGGSNTAPYQLFEHLSGQQYGEITPPILRDAVSDFESRINDLNDTTITKSTSATTRRHYIESLSSTLLAISATGILPRIGPLRFYTKPRFSHQNTPSLCELSSKTIPAARHGDYAEAQALNRTRLDRLRKVMETNLLQQHAVFRRGQQLLNCSSGPSASEVAALLESVKEVTPHSKYTLPAEYNAIFPSRDKPNYLVSRQIALLRYFSEVYGCSIPYERLPYITRVTIESSGGARNLRAMLEGTSTSLTAAFSIVLIDTGMNVQPCLDLSSDPFIGEAVHGRTRLAIVSSNKCRAGYKPVSSFLFEGEAFLKARNHAISTVDAIKLWLEMAEPIRHRARMEGQGLDRYLWIFPWGRGNGQNVVRVNSTTYRDCWIEILRHHADDPIIGGLPIRRKHIRPTWIQIHSDELGGDAELSALIANHASSKTTLSHYLNKSHIKSQLSQLVREFQNQLEAAILIEPENFSAELGLDVDTLRSRRARGHDTGLGDICNAPRNLDADSAGMSECLDIDLCPDCPFRRHAETDDAIRGAIFARLSLEKAIEVYPSQNPERWLRVWIKRYALAIAQCNAHASGRRKYRYRELVEEVTNKVRNNSLPLLSIW